VTDPNGVVTVATALSALAAWVALGFSIYNTITQRRDRTQSVKMIAGWSSPYDGPEAATLNPGEIVFECEITNNALVGVKISRVQLHFDLPSAPYQLHLPEGEQPKKLDNGDSQRWVGTFPESATYVDAYSEPEGWKYGPWHSVTAWDTAGNFYEVKNPYVHMPVQRPWWHRWFGGWYGPKNPYQRPWWKRWFSAQPRSGTSPPTEASEGAQEGAERVSWWRRLFGG
jgi:hypothetical protein